MIRCIAVDDEPLAINVIEHFCNKTPELELVCSFTNAPEALSYLKENSIDLVFLDINMPQMTGVELAKNLDKSIMVIFTTAYQNYAVEGYELEAVDYLLKPFSYDRFVRAINKAELMQSARQLLKPSEGDQDKAPFIMIRSDYSTVRVDTDTIICVEGLKDYVKIYTDDKNYVTKITMKLIDEHLSPYGFMRIHKSYIINLSKIKYVEHNHIMLNKDIGVSVGNSYRNNFTEYLKLNKIK